MPFFPRVYSDVMNPVRILSVLVSCVALLAASLTSMVAADEPVLRRCLVTLIDEAKVPAREAGVLVELAVHEGQDVTKGQVIAKIDDNQPQMEKRKARAEHDQALARAESDVDIRFSKESAGVAKLEWDKAEESHRRAPQSVSEIERKRLELNFMKSTLQIEQAELEQKLARLASDSKQVEVDAAESAIERRQITAPLEGEVVEVFPHLGEWMQPGDPLARVVRTDKVRVEGYVDSAKWDPETVRDRPVTVVVTLAGDRQETFSGRIVFTSPIVESGGDYRVWAEVANRRENNSDIWIMRPGMTATMQIHSDQAPLAARAAAR
jgi:multidrug efflux pump subunit AcrA (membrane-fusion protein)